MALVKAVYNKHTKSTSHWYSGFYFKSWSIEQTKTGYQIYNDITGDSATISNTFLAEFYNNDILLLIKQALNDLPPFKQTNDIALLAKIDRFNSGYTRFKRELKTAFELVNYSYISLFENELPTTFNKGI